MNGVSKALIDFLGVPTPTAWLEAALSDLDTLLLDHAACELKAASTALATLRRYPEHPALVQRMSKLAREELRHFEQVCTVLRRRGLEYQPVSASGYARGLRHSMAEEEPGRLADLLISGAFIEARSCERFALVAGSLTAEPEVADLYEGLLASEARHFQVYLDLAEEIFSRSQINPRIVDLRRVENQLILEPVSEVRFHSGPPAADVRAA